MKRVSAQDTSLVESSIQRSGIDESTSFIETVTSSSIQSSRRPNKIQKNT